MTEPEEKSKNNDDGLLRYLVHLANLEALNIGITLTVKGIIISGILIGYKRYFNGISIALAKSNVLSAIEGQENKPSEPLMIVNQEIQKMKESVKEEPAGVIGEINYIHLENAVIINDKPSQPSLWRIRFSSVDSFTLGQLGLSNELLAQQQSEL